MRMGGMQELCIPPIFGTLVSIGFLIVDAERITEMIQVLVNHYVTNATLGMHKRE